MADQMRQSMRTVMSLRWGYLSARCLTGQENKIQYNIPTILRRMTKKNTSYGFQQNLFVVIIIIKRIRSDKSLYSTTLLSTFRFLVFSHLKTYKIKSKRQCKLSSPPPDWCLITDHCSDGVQVLRGPEPREDCVWCLCPHSHKSGPIPHSEAGSGGTPGTWHDTQRVWWSKLSMGKQRSCYLLT